MYHTGLNPQNGKPVYVPRQEKERKWQRALLQYRNRENENLVREALLACGREDLIGSSARSLVRGKGVPTTKGKPVPVISGKKNRPALGKVKKKK